MHADTPAEILGTLIEGYSAIADERERLRARLRLATDAQFTVQNVLNAGEMFGYATDEESRTLLHDRNAVPTPDEWRCAVPLVLVTLFHHPLGEHPQPKTAPPGQIWWIDPSAEKSLLETLHAVRWLDLVRAPRNDPDDGTAYRNLGTNGGGGYHWRPLPS